MGARRNKLFTILAKISRGGSLSTKHEEELAKSVSRLSNWWAGLNDDERERFYHNYLDPEKQHMGRVVHPLHENQTLEIPAGMEKMREREWSFHTYQKKAINFGLARERVLWAMEMGLGKTLCALGLFHHLKNEKTPL